MLIIPPDVGHGRRIHAKYRNPRIGFDQRIYVYMFTQRLDALVYD